LNALEDAMKYRGVKACLLIANFSNPLGSCMPDEHKKTAVLLAEKYNVPLIENDLNGDVYFGPHRPKSCKTYDTSGIVLWCGSVSKTLAPGYRVQAFLIRNRTIKQYRWYHRFCTILGDAGQSIHRRLNHFLSAERCIFPPAVPQSFYARPACSFLAGY